VIEHPREALADRVQVVTVKEALDDQEPVAAVGLDLLLGRLRHARSLKRRAR
jgi:hypothetical protein